MYATRAFLDSWYRIRNAVCSGNVPSTCTYATRTSHFVLVTFFQFFQNMVLRREWLSLYCCSFVGPAPNSQSMAKSSAQFSTATLLVRFVFSSVLAARYVCFCSGRRRWDCLPEYFDRHFTLEKILTRISGSNRRINFDKRKRTNVVPKEISRHDYCVKTKWNVQKCVQLAWGAWASPESQTCAKLCCFHVAPNE